MILDLTIQTPPIGKGRPRLGRGRRVFTPKRTRDFEALIARHVRRVYDGDPVSGTVGICVDAYFRRPAKPPRGHACHSGPAEAFPLAMGGSHYPDADNVLKAVSDALNALVYVDDAQIADARCRRWWADQGQASCVRVRVWRIGVHG